MRASFRTIYAGDIGMATATRPYPSLRGSGDVGHRVVGQYVIGGTRQFRVKRRGRTFVLPRRPKTQVFQDPLHNARIVDERDYPHRPFALSCLTND